MSSSSQRAPFERIPLEIAMHIIKIYRQNYLWEYPGRREVLGLRLASRRLCSLFTPLVISDYTYHATLSREGINNDASRSTPVRPIYRPIPAAFAAYVGHLKLSAVAVPHFDAMESAVTCTAGADERQNFGRLLEELSLMTSLKLLDWSDECEGGRDTENAKMLSFMDKVISTIRAASGDSLRKIRINTETQYSLPHSLTLFSSLSELVLISSWEFRHTTTEERRRAFISQIRSIIVRNKSTLQHIKFQLPSDIALTLEDIFPPEAVDLRLVSVRLENVQNSVPTALASLPQLRRFSMETRYDDPSEADHIWDTLRAHKIALQETNNYPTISHMKYLGSFSGLTTLQLYISAPLDSTVTQTFFGVVLPAQAESLENLGFHYTSPTPVYDGFVYSSRHLWFGGLSFPRLRYVRVYAPSDWDLNQARCQVLLNGMQDFPVLETFSVQWLKYVPLERTNQLRLLCTKTGRPSQFCVAIREGEYNIRLRKSDL